VLCFSSGKRVPRRPGWIAAARTSHRSGSLRSWKRTDGGKLDRPGLHCEGKEGDGGRGTSKKSMRGARWLLGYAFVGRDLRPFIVEAQACRPLAFVYLSPHRTIIGSALDDGRRRSSLGSI
jgi:hypothetical protein